MKSLSRKYSYVRVILHFLAVRTGWCQENESAGEDVEKLETGGNVK